MTKLEKAAAWLKKRRGIYLRDADTDETIRNIDTCIDAVRAEMERERGCEWCELHSVMSIMFDDEPFGFCPKCGKKIEKGETE